MSEHLTQHGAIQDNGERATLPMFARASSSQRTAVAFAVSSASIAQRQSDSKLDVTDANDSEGVTDPSIDAASLTDAIRAAGR